MIIHIVILFALTLKGVVHTEVDTMMIILELQSKKGYYVCTYLLFQALEQT